ncbi:BTAD domain-containing putative transcriptional regulator [Micromonospora tulbaghiae]|uniref:BTAD domain-containing putative transcriptional regulator n=1 Tax=Micromonospora tulbaghiae TaxID=479978 RepID=UPI0033F555BF
MTKEPSTAAVRIVTVALALAPPVLLYRAGWLTLQGLSAAQMRQWLHEPLTAGFLAVLGQTGLWLLWIFLMATVTDHSYRRLAARMRWQYNLRLPRPVQAFTAAMLGSTAATSVALPALAQGHTTSDSGSLPATPREAGDPTLTHDAPSPAPTVDYAAMTEPADAATVSPRPAAPPAEPRKNTGDVAAARTSPRESVRVAAGDTLWDLAAEHLGAGSRWPEIYKLNRKHRQADGRALTDPNVIRIGWKLTLPTRRAAAPPTPHKNHHPDPRAPETAGSEANPPFATPAPHPSPPGTTGPSTARAPAEAAPSGSGTAREQPDRPGGIALPTQGWISLGLAAAIASTAALAGMQRRRHARLTFALPGTAVPPVPAFLTRISAANPAERSNHRSAAVGIDTSAAERSLFDLPGPGLALHGDGTIAAARAILAATLTTGTTDTAATRPVVVTTADLLARLLPDGAPAVGLDPDGTAYDGERLMVLADTAAAVTHAEEEMIGRRRLLDSFDVATVADLNARTDHAEHQPPYVLLIDSTPRYAARVHAIAAHRAVLDLHPVLLGHHEGIPTVDITADGTVTNDAPSPVARMSTLGADDLATVLALLTDTLARPEAGIDIDEPLAEAPPAGGPAEPREPVPVQPADAAALVRLQVLGPVTVTTASGPVRTGMRSGSYTALAVLAAHPAGRTLGQLTADLHPDVDPSAAVKRVRTDINTARKVLRAETGHREHMFIVYDPATGRYQLDPETIAVDLWHMLTAIQHAADATDDQATLTALRRATELYTGDFAEGHDYLWATACATAYRHQILTAYARIAEILEPDHPDQAIAALEHAADLDPVNEELYQRIMRIHGRQHRPDAVRRTLRRLEKHLTDFCDAEPSQATRRVAERQLQPASVNRARP